MITIDCEFVSEFIKKDSQNEPKAKYFRCQISGDSLSELLSNARELKSQLHHFYEGRSDYTGRTMLEFPKSEVI